MILPHNIMVFLYKKLIKYCIDFIMWDNISLHACQDAIWGVYRLTVGILIAFTEHSHIYDVLLPLLLPSQQIAMESQKNNIWATS